METKLILDSLKQAIKELQYEKWQQERNGLTKAALNFIDELEAKVNELERSSDKCHIQNVSKRFLVTYSYTNKTDAAIHEKK